MRGVSPNRLGRFFALVVFNLAVWAGLVLIHSMPEFPIGMLQPLRTATGVLFGLPIGWLVLVDDGLRVFAQPGEPLDHIWPPFGALLLPNAILWGLSAERLIHRLYDRPDAE